jgi:hypothetical protein
MGKKTASGEIEDERVRKQAEIIGRNVRNYLARKNLSETQWAVDCETRFPDYALTQKTINNIIRARQPIGLTALVHLAYMMKVKPADLMYPPEHPHANPDLAPAKHSEGEEK